MPLTAPRLASNATLRACVDSGYRLHSGEQDTEAVKILQRSLHDLGYRKVGDSDGVFGSSTGEALVAFKTDEGLQPNDAVASTGTISRLDGYFAAEPADPDHPDASTDGLVDLALATMDVAVAWLDAALADLTGGDAVVLQRVEELFLVSRTPGLAGTIPPALVEYFQMARRGLRTPEPFMQPSVRTRGNWQPGLPFLTSGRSASALLAITPAFRNTLSDEDRAGEVIRHAVAVTGVVKTFAIPRSPRHANLIGDEGLSNGLAFAAFAHESYTGTQRVWPPSWSWPS